MYLQRKAYIITSNKNQYGDLPGAAQRIECWLENQRVTGLIPSQGITWVAGRVPSRGCMSATTH